MKGEMMRGVKNDGGWEGDMGRGAEDVNVDGRRDDEGRMWDVYGGFL